MTKVKKPIKFEKARHAELESKVVEDVSYSTLLKGQLQCVSAQVQEVARQTMKETFCI